MPLQIELANLADPVQQSAIFELLDMYASEPVGGGQTLGEEVRHRLITGLAEQAHGRYFLGWHDQQPVAVAICFLGYSTFQARPLLNIHDLAVHREFRGRGLGTQLLRSLEAAAQRWGCCKLTLEVRHDNPAARRLYEQLGFAGGGPAGSDTSFLAKPLLVTN